MAIHGGESAVGGGIYIAGRSQGKDQLGGDREADRATRTDDEAQGQQCRWHLQAMGLLAGVGGWFGGDGFGTRIRRDEFDSDKCTSPPTTTIGRKDMRKIRVCIYRPSFANNFNDIHLNPSHWAWC